MSVTATDFPSYSPRSDIGSCANGMPMNSGDRHTEIYVLVLALRSLGEIALV